MENDLHLVIKGNTLLYCTKDLFKPITDIIIPEGIEVIEENAFVEITTLMYVRFPSTLRIIKRNAFKGCPLRYTKELPESVKEIHEGAFSNTSFGFSPEMNIVSINIPKTVEFIHENAFNNSLLRFNYFNFRDLTINELISFINVKEDFIINGISLIGYKGDSETVTIPDNVLTIESHAFYNSKIKTINTNKVETIESYAFLSCDN